MRRDSLGEVREPPHAAGPRVCCHHGAVRPGSRTAAGGGGSAVRRDSLGEVREPPHAAGPRVLRHHGALRLGSRHGQAETLGGGGEGGKSNRRGTGCHVPRMSFLITHGPLTYNTPLIEAGPRVLGLARWRRLGGEGARQPRHAAEGRSVAAGSSAGFGFLCGGSRVAGLALQLSLSEEARAPSEARCSLSAQSGSRLSCGDLIVT